MSLLAEVRRVSCRVSLCGVVVAGSRLRRWCGRALGCGGRRVAGACSGAGGRSGFGAGLSVGGGRLAGVGRVRRRRVGLVRRSRSVCGALPWGARRLGAGLGGCGRCAVGCGARAGGALPAAVCGALVRCGLSRWSARWLCRAAVLSLGGVWCRALSCSSRGARGSGRACCRVAAARMSGGVACGSLAGRSVARWSCARVPRRVACGAEWLAAARLCFPWEVCRVALCLVRRFALACRSLGRPGPRYRRRLRVLRCAVLLGGLRRGWGCARPLRARVARRCPPGLRVRRGECLGRRVRRSPFRGCRCVVGGGGWRVRGLVPRWPPLRAAAGAPCHALPRCPLSRWLAGPSSSASLYTRVQTPLRRVCDVFATASGIWLEGEFS